MRAKVGEVYLDTNENKLFEIREVNLYNYTISQLCTYFNDTHTVCHELNTHLSYWYRARYCERVEIYSNLLVRDTNGVRVRLKADDIKTVISSPFNYPAEVGGIYYDEKDNRLFKLLAIRQDDLIISTKWIFYKNALETNSSHRYMNIQYFNRYCVRAHQDSSFLAKESGLSRVPKQPTKTDVYRAHIKVEPVQPRCNYGAYVGGAKPVFPIHSTLENVLNGFSDKELIKELYNLPEKDVIRLAQKIHGRMYRIIRGKE